MSRNAVSLAALLLLGLAPAAQARVAYDFESGISGFVPTPHDSWDGGPDSDGLAIHLPIIGSDNAFETGVVSVLPLVFTGTTTPTMSFELSVTDQFIDMIDLSDLFFAELVDELNVIEFYSLCFGCVGTPDDFRDIESVQVERNDPSGAISAGDVFNIRFRYRHEVREESIEVGLFQIDNLVIDGAVVLGDTNGDNRVDVDDLNNVRNNFGQSGPSVPGDTNFDGTVNIDDLNNVRNHFGAGAATVPEPASMFLLLWGVCLSWVLRGSIVRQ